MANKTLLQLQAIFTEDRSILSARIQDALTQLQTIHRDGIQANQDERVNLAKAIHAHEIAQARDTQIRETTVMLARLHNNLNPDGDLVVTTQLTCIAYSRSPIHEVATPEEFLAQLRPEDLAKLQNDLRITCRKTKPKEYGITTLRGEFPLAFYKSKSHGSQRFPILRHSSGVRFQCPSFSVSGSEHDPATHRRQTDEGLNEAQWHDLGTTTIVSTAAAGPGPATPLKPESPPLTKHKENPPLPEAKAPEKPRPHAAKAQERPTEFHYKAPAQSVRDSLDYHILHRLELSTREKPKARRDDYLKFTTPVLDALKAIGCTTKETPLGHNQDYSIVIEWAGVATCTKLPELEKAKATLDAFSKRQEKAPETLVYGTLKEWLLSVSGKELLQLISDRITALKTEAQTRKDQETKKSSDELLAHMTQEEATTPSKEWQQSEKFCRELPPIVLDNLETALKADNPILILRILELIQTISNDEKGHPLARNGIKAKPFQDRLHALLETYLEGKLDTLQTTLPAQTNLTSTEARQAHIKAVLGLGVEAFSRTQKLGEAQQKQVSDQFYAAFAEILTARSNHDLVRLFIDAAVELEKAQLLAPHYGPSDSFSEAAATFLQAPHIYNRIPGIPDDIAAFFRERCDLEPSSRKKEALVVTFILLLILGGIALAYLFLIGDQAPTQREAQPQRKAPPRPKPKSEPLIAPDITTFSNGVRSDGGKHVYQSGIEVYGKISIKNGIIFYAPETVLNYEKTSKDPLNRVIGSLFGDRKVKTITTLDDKCPSDMPDDYGNEAANAKWLKGLKKRENTPTLMRESEVTCSGEIKFTDGSIYRGGLLIAHAGVMANGKGEFKDENGKVSKGLFSFSVLD